jgi:hypothetical protein
MLRRDFDAAASVRRNNGPAVCNHGEFRLHTEIGPIVFGGLSAIFAGYGIRELALAYKAVALKEWSERAALGAAGVLLAALFVAMTCQILG